MRLSRSKVQKKIFKLGFALEIEIEISKQNNVFIHWAKKIQRDI